VYCENKKEYERVSGKFLEVMSEGYKYIDLCLAPGLNKILNDVKFTEQKLQLLDISVSHETIQKKYSDNLKRNIKKAIKENIALEFGFSVEAHVKDFKKENSKKIKAFKAKEYSNMALLLAELVKRNKAFIVAAKTQTGMVCASASFINCGNRLVYFKSSANEQGKQNGAIHFLMDEVIKKYVGQFELFDFYGSNVASVARFNQGFHTNDYIYYRVKKNKLPLLLKLIKK
jgi:hypothetical protein